MKNKQLLYIPLFFIIVIMALIYFSRFTTSPYENVFLGVYDETTSGWNITTFKDGNEIPMSSSDIYGYDGTVVLRRRVEPFFNDFNRINIASITAACVFIDDELVFSTIDDPIDQIQELPLLKSNPELPFHLTFSIQPSWIGKTMSIVTRDFEGEPVGSIGIDLINDHYYNLQHEAVTNALALPAGAYGLLSILLFGLFLYSSFTYKTDFSILILGLASTCLVFMQTSYLQERIFLNSAYHMFASLLYLLTFIYIGLNLTKTKKWFLSMSITIWLIYFAIFISMNYLYLPLPYWLYHISVILFIPLIFLCGTCWIEHSYNRFAKLLPFILGGFIVFGILLYFTAFLISSDIYLHMNSILNETAHLYVEPILGSIFTILIFSFFILSIYQIIQNQLNDATLLSNLKLTNRLHEQSLKHAEQTNAQLAIMRHDELHHLRTLSTYLCEDTQKARDYLNSLTGDLEKIATVRFSNNRLMNSILSAVNYHAKEQEVAFNVFVNVKEHLDLEDKDVSMVLMNLCHNAINAASVSDEKIVNVKLRQDDDMLYIMISNSIPLHFDKKRFNEMIHTPKTDHNQLHGHGLLSVSKILKTYGGELNFEIESNEIIIKTVMQFQ